jgi:hypothetical protein
MARGDCVSATDVARNMDAPPGKPQYHLAGLPQARLYYLSTKESSHEGQLKYDAVTPTFVWIDFRPSLKVWLSGYSPEARETATIWVPRTAIDRLKFYPVGKTRLEFEADGAEWAFEFGCEKHRAAFRATHAAAMAERCRFELIYKEEFRFKGGGSVSEGSGETLAQWGKRRI